MDSRERSVEIVGVKGMLRGLHGLHYPISKGDLLDLVRDRRIRWVKAEKPIRVRLKELVEALPNRTFRDEADLAAELRQAAERRGLPAE